MHWIKIVTLATGIQALMNFPVAKQKREIGGDDLFYNNDDWLYYYIHAKIGSQSHPVNLPLTFFGVHVDIGDASQECMSTRISDDLYHFEIHSDTYPGLDLFKDDDSFNVTDLDTFEPLPKDPKYNTLYLARDQITIGDLTAKNVLLQMSLECSPQIGIHLGFSSVKVKDTTLQSNRTETKNFVQLLKEQEQIKSSVAGFAFPKNNSTTGSMIFGGVDKSWYEGLLGIVKIANPDALLGYSESEQFYLILDGLTVGDIHMEVPRVIAGFLGDPLDGRATFSTSWMEALAEQFGGLYFDEMEYEGSYVFLNAAFDKMRDLTFNFGGVEIKVPANAFRLEYNDTHSYFDVDDTEESLFVAIGSVIMGHAYWAIDYDTHEVGIAQLRETKQDADIFKEATSGIPDATKASGYSLTYLEEYFVPTLTTSYSSHGITRLITRYGVTTGPASHFSLLLEEQGVPTNSGSQQSGTTKAGSGSLVLLLTTTLSSKMSSSVQSTSSQAPSSLKNSADNLATNINYIWGPVFAGIMLLLSL